MKRSHIWTDENCAVFEATYPVWTTARLGYELALNTCQRGSDLVRIGPQNISGDVLQIEQQKTRTELDVPILPALATCLAKTAIGQQSFLVSTSGDPFTPHAFAAWFRKRCADAGL